jgi:hypothetical protein
MYLAGFVLATGASLALAGPASAAASHNHPGKCAHNHSSVQDDWYGDRGDTTIVYSDSHDQKWSLLSGIGILGIGSNY